MLRLIVGGNADPSLSGQRHDELGALTAAVQRGDATALRTFLVTIVPHLLRVARRVLGPDHAEIEDVAYEAAYAVVDGLPQFRGQATVLHYACRVAVLTAMNVRRRDAAQKRARTRDARDPDTVERDEPNPEEQAMHASLAPLIRDLLLALSPPLAEALALHTILGYTVNEIAETCGVPSETVRSRLRLAKEALRKRVLGNPRLREAVESEA